MKEDDDHVKPVVIDHPKTNSASSESSLGPTNGDEQNFADASADASADRSILKYTSASF